MEDEAADENSVTYKQFRSMVGRRPEIMRWMYLDLERMKQGARLLLKPGKYRKNMAALQK